ncbi:DUF6907 domain-containing protein [Streptomyces sp. DT24]|uniref:DUF6907 domain-containing protein n=1 Tax=Streptomyces sp. DT24 TaxID=3416520 RepID=UPI003CF439AF
MRMCPGAVDPGEDSVVFAAEMQCRPYTGGDSGSRVPVLNIQVFDDMWFTDLDPAGIAEVAAQFRCFADLLENRAVPELTAARADWERHHRLRHGSGRTALHGQITQPCPAAPDAHSPQGSAL